MRTVRAVAVTSFLIVGLAWPAAKTVRQTSTYSSSVYGFSISAPRLPGGAGLPVTPVIMSGPPENGFASNVNVIIQNVSTSRQAYRDLSVRQFQQLGYTVHSERNLTVSGRDSVLFDYEGTTQGRELRFLALAVIDRGRVFVVTGTAPRESFTKYEPSFRASITSFRITR